MRRIFTFSMMLLTVTSMMAQQKVKTSPWNNLVRKTQ